MGCPFNHKPATKTATPLGEIDTNISRRALIGWGAGIGMCGLVPACADLDANGNDVSNVTQGGASFLDLYDDLAITHAGDPAKLIGARGALVKSWLNTKYDALFAELRESRPVLFTHPKVPTLLADFRNVTFVLDEDSNDEFAVLAYSGEATRTLGVFSLADINLARHDADKAVHNSSSPDVKSYAEIVRWEAEQLVNEVRGTGSIDVVQDVARLLPVRVVNKYFGVPSGEDAEAYGGPTELQMYQLIADSFQNFFLNLGGDEEVRKAGRDAADKLMAYLQSLIAARRPEVLANQGDANDVLAHFIIAANDGVPTFDDTGKGVDERIAANICGIIVGAVVTIEKVIANQLSVLFDDKWDDAVLDGAIAAANANDNDTLWAYGQEALRFKPQGVAIPRVVNADGVTLTDDVNGTEIALPKGSLVLAATPSAMRDGNRFDDPESFRANREPADYLHFGYSRYECQGKRMAMLESTEALRAILQLPGLRKPEGSELIYKGPYPDSFVLTFDA